MILLGTVSLCCPWHIHFKMTTISRQTNSVQPRNFTFPAPTLAARSEAIILIDKQRVPYEFSQPQNTFRCFFTQCKIPYYRKRVIFLSLYFAKKTTSYLCNRLPNWYNAVLKNHDVSEFGSRVAEYEIDTERSKCRPLSHVLPFDMKIQTWVFFFYVRNKTTECYQHLPNIGDQLDSSPRSKQLLVRLSWSYSLNA